MSPVIAFKVFDCQILPILEYASDIWYTSDSVNDLEKIHLKFIKSTLGVRKQTPTPVIYGDTGRFPLIIRQHIKAVKYWCRILDLSQNHPVRNAYNMLLELDGTGFTNWCSRIRSVLELTGLDQAWETQHIGNTNKFMLSFKDSIVRIFTQRWRQDIESSSKLEILLNSIVGIINMQPTNDIFLRIMTSRDITVVKSLAKFIYGCFKQIKG